MGPPVGLSLAVALVALAVVGCTANDSRPTAGPSPTDGQETSSAPATEQPAAEPSLRPGEVALEFSGAESGTPSVVVKARPGYQSYLGFALLAGEGSRFRGLGAWNAVDVATDPCRDREWRDPGPSVRDLAEALAGQPSRRATDPVPATLGGHDGLSFTMTVPDGLRLARCDAGVFEDWHSPVTPHQQPGPGTLDTVWILDAEGHRVLIHAFHRAGTTRAQVAELNRMVRSLKFVPAA